MPSYTFPATTTQPPQATDDGSPMRSIADGAAFEWYLPLSAGRAEVERHIAEAFQRAYGAMVTTFCPTLLALRRAGQLCAAVGLRPALEPLFLESYLSAPVQQVLGSRVDAPVRRSQLAEIGNLVSNGGASPLLLLLLTAAAERAGFEWLVFTATPLVEKNIARLGFDLLELGPADPIALGAKAAHWGTYYQSQPRVMAGHLPSALARVERSPRLSDMLARYRAPVAELSAALNRTSGTANAAA